MKPPPAWATIDGLYEVESRTCSFRRDTRGFIHAVMKAGCEMDLADARENIAHIFDLGGEQRNRVLVDTRGLRWQTKEARDYWVGPEAERATWAVALLVGSPVSRVIGNFFMRFGAHRFPTALFSDEEGAVRWLLEQRHE